MQNLLLVKPQHSPLMLNDGAENSSCLLSPYYVPSALQQFREAVKWVVAHFFRQGNKEKKSCGPGHPEREQQNQSEPRN